MGYGLTLALAGFGAVVSLRAVRRKAPLPGRLTPEALVLFITWMAVNIAASYLPVAFQRKLIQGSHFPIAIMAAVAVAHLIEITETKFQRRLYVAYSAIIVALLSLSPLKSLVAAAPRLTSGIETATAERYYVSHDEFDALSWLDKHAAADDLVQPLPHIGLDPSGGAIPTDVTLATLAPGISGRPVYFGHWAESPQFIDKLVATFAAIAQLNSPDADRALKALRIRYLVVDSSAAAGTERVAPVLFVSKSQPPGLRRVYSNETMVVYEVLSTK
jgi:hypothetical protein